MQVLVSVKLSPHKYKTPEGYLYCQDAIIARTGKQQYMRSELYINCDDDTIVEVDRPYEEVTNPKTIASFEDKPITCEHPEENVGPNNYNELAVGHSRNVRVGPEKVDGETVLISDLIITDAQCIEDIENGIRTDLSCGYDCDITDEPNPRQVNIRGNHIALCEAGRAGCARIIDSKNKNSKEDDIKRLIREEESAIKSYELAIEAAKKRGDTEAVKVLEHIMQEEIEHKSELEMQAELSDWNIQKILKDADNLHIKYICKEQNLIDSTYSFIGSARALNELKNKYNKKLLNIKESIIDSKKSITDSLSKGTLIQEFGKNGAQYKIIKIEKNTIYAEDVINDKLTLFRKDKQGIDWDCINKSDIKDSMSNILAEINNIKNILNEKNINADIKQSYAAITIKFNNKADLNKVFKDLKDIYDCERDTEKLLVTIFDKLKADFKDTAKKSINDRLVLTKSVKDNDYSRKFYIKALDTLQKKLNRLEVNKVLDGYNQEYEFEKNKYKQLLKEQIDYYKQKIKELDK